MKKVLALFTIAVLAVCLTACGGQKSEEEDSKTAGDKKQKAEENVSEDNPYLTTVSEGTSLKMGFVVMDISNQIGRAHV